MYKSETKRKDLEVTEGFLLLLLWDLFPSGFRVGEPWGSSHKPSDNVILYKSAVGGEGGEGAVLLRVETSSLEEQEGIWDWELG